jgi:hypothetical protein
MSVQETRMMARALTQRWPISEKTKRGVIGALINILADPKASPREKTSAAKALMAAEQQNQADEHKLVDVSLSTRNFELDAIAADLGVEIGIVEDASRKAEIGVDRIEGDGGTGTIQGAYQ